MYLYFSVYVFTFRPLFLSIRVVKLYVVSCMYTTGLHGPRGWPPALERPGQHGVQCETCGGAKEQCVCATCNPGCANSKGGDREVAGRKVPHVTRPGPV